MSLDSFREIDQFRERFGSILDDFDELQFQNGKRMVKSTSRRGLYTIFNKDASIQLPALPKVPEAIHQETFPSATNGTASKEDDPEAFFTSIDFRVNWNDYIGTPDQNVPYVSDALKLKHGRNCQVVGCLVDRNRYIENTWTLKAPVTYGDRLLMEYGATSLLKYPSLQSGAIPFSDEYGYGYGTAFHVGEGVVLTAGHCVWDSSNPNQGKLKDMSNHRVCFGLATLPKSSNVPFLPNMVQIDDTMSWEIERLLYASEKRMYVNPGPSVPDFALFKVKQKSALTANTINGYPAITALLATKPALARATVYTMGHPSGLPVKLSKVRPGIDDIGGNVGIIPKVDSPFKMSHTLPTLPGNSGSPVFKTNPDPNDDQVVGIHVSGPTSLYTFTPRTTQLQEKILNPEFRFSSATRVNRLRWLVDRDATISGYIQFFDPEDYPGTRRQQDLAKWRPFKEPTGPCVVKLYFNDPADELELATIPIPLYANREDDGNSQSTYFGVEKFSAPGFCSILGPQNQPRVLPILLRRLTVAIFETPVMEYSSAYRPRVRALKIMVHKENYPQRGICICDKTFDDMSSAIEITENNAYRVDFDVILPQIKDCLWPT